MKQTYSHGIIPDDLAITEPYRMELIRQDLTTVAAIVNQGIDSHLEAVFTEQGPVGHKTDVAIMDTKSMRCFIRRCMESGDEKAESLAADIITTLGYEWI